MPGPYAILSPPRLCALLVLANLSSCSLWRSRSDEASASPWRKDKGLRLGKTPVKSSIREVSQVLGFNSEQVKRLEQDGLLVTPTPPKIGSVPAPIYDQIYQHDLPVLITSDSILYAFHRRYMKFLANLEEGPLFSLLLETLLTTRAELDIQLAAKVLDLPTAVELDVYLTVALSFIVGPIGPALKETPPGRVEQALTFIHEEKVRDFNIFDATLKNLDFSQFQPRGHYSRSDKLKAYFRCIMWLSTVRLDLVTYPRSQPTLNRGALKFAAALTLLMQQGGAQEKLQSYLAALDDFVGPADDDNPLSLAKFLSAHKVSTAASLQELSDQEIHTWLASNQSQRSRIVSHFHINEKLKPNSKTARSFVFIGQRFAFDSYLLGQLVFDKLVLPSRPKEPIPRFMPKGLDLMAALGNPRAKVHLKAEFDRYKYEPALDRLAAQVRAQPESYWTSSLHSAWLRAIASLHQNSDDPRLPAVFRSAAWKDKTLQTQLASWAELRHDHILHVKQPVTGTMGCEFPDAYVEPVPHVFAKIKQMVSKLHAVTDRLETQGIKLESSVHEELLHFSQVLDQLHTIADKELRHEAPTKKEKKFLKQAVESEAIGYGLRRWDGWYPKIMGLSPTNDFEPTIADVHTDPANANNNWTTQVLHVGTGRFELATVAVDCPGNKKCVYVGPVSSYYEFIPKNGARLTDEAWRSMIFEPYTERHRPRWIESFHDSSALTDLERESIKMMEKFDADGARPGKLKPIGDE